MPFAPLGPSPRWPADRGLARRPPPRPWVPPRARYPLLLGLERLLAERGAAAARPEARRLVGPGELGPRALAAVLWSCPPCAADALAALAARADRSGWRWQDARELLPLLGHPREAVRAGALWAFGAAATRLAPGPLRARLEHHLPVFRPLALDPSPWVRAEALALLGHLRDRRSHVLLRGLLLDPEPVVRAAAVDAIARAVTLVPGAPSTKEVCDRLADPSPAVRSATLEAVGEAPGACPLGHVAALLGDRYRVRLRLITREGGDLGLRRRGGEVRHAAWRALPAALRPAAPRLPWDPRIADARAAFARAGLPAEPQPAASRPPRPCRPGPYRPPAPRPGAAADPALALLGGDGGAPGEILGRLTPPPAGPLRGPLLAAALGLLGSPRAEVRWRALGWVHLAGSDEGARPALARALFLAAQDPHPLVRRAALSLAVRLHAGAAVRAVLERALRDPHPALRLEAVTLLARGAPDRARALLPPLATDRAPVVRAAALHALVREPGAEFPAAVVVRALDDRAPASLRVGIGGEEVRIDPGFGTVRSAVLMALEAARGPRHRGTEAERARRWQDDLRLGPAPAPAPP